MVTYPSNPVIRETGYARFDHADIGDLTINGVPVVAQTSLNVYSSTALNAGELVYISGYSAASGSYLAVSPATANNPYSAAQYVVTTTTTGAGTLNVYGDYLVTGLNTAALTQGALVYLSTAGGYSATAPTGASQISQIVGTVVTVNAVSGSIRFYPVKNLIVAIGSSNLQAGSVAIASKATNDASSLFMMTISHNYGSSASAVYTDMGTAPAKGQLIGVYYTNTVAQAGSTNSTIILAKDTGGSTAMTSSVTLTAADTVYSNLVGGVLGGAPVSGGNSIIASGSHVYAYTGAATSRSAGTVRVVALFQVVS